MNRNKKKLAYFLCLMVYTIFGFSFLFSKTTLRYASPLLMIAVRFLVAFLVLNAMLLTGKVKISLRGKPVGKLLLLGLIQPVLYFVFETYGIKLTSSAFAGVMLGLLPVAGLLAGAIFLKESIGIYQIICVILSVAGVAMTTFGGTVKVSILGTVMLLGAVASAAMFSVISRTIADVFTPFERTYVMFLLGSVIFWIAALIQAKGQILTSLKGLGHAQFWTGIFYLAVISSVCAFMFLNYALNYISVGTQTLMSNFCTVVSILAGIFIMHDQFSVIQLLGVAIVLVSVIGASKTN